MRRHELTDDQSELIVDLMPVAPPENSIRVAYRTSGATASGFYSLAYIRDVPYAGVTYAGDTASRCKRIG